MEKGIPGRDKRPMKSHGGETKDVLLTYLPNRSTGFNVEPKVNRIMRE